MEKKDIINSFGEKKILLVGDTILDIYSYCREVCRSSNSEASEVEEDKTSVSFGGASLVASNILELGGKVIFFSVIGDDENAKHYDGLYYPRLDKHFLVDKNRRTTVKKRFWVNGQKLFQANQVDNQEIDFQLEAKLIGEMEPFLNQVDLILVLDARHGLLSKGLINQLLSLSQKYQKPLYVDSQISHKPSNHHLYQGADCLFLNQKEASAVDSSFKAENPASLNSLKEKLKTANVVVKLGKQGSVALFNGKYLQGLPHQVEEVDPCGAGDAFLAAFSLGSREVAEESLAIANAWSALAVTVYGTTPPKKQDLIKIYG